jgi:hypothetical protein
MKWLRLGTATLALGALAASALPGTKEKEIAPGIWQVRASANAASGGYDHARAQVDRRAGELMRAKGFTHVRILDRGGFSLDSADGSYTPGGVGPGYATIVVRGASGMDDVAGCRARNPKRCATRPVAALIAGIGE